jgi:GR25 family glycosyltransferase involved in LPS biosynthesis
MRDNLNVFIIIIVIISSVAVICVVNGNQNNIFDHTYLMNLKRRPDRLKRFLNEYNKSDMKFVQLKKIIAVDGSEIDILKIPLTETARGELKQIETTGFRSKHYQLTRGAIGCYLSHVKIWKDIVENNYKTALIFEDDAKVPKDILKRINTNMQYIPNDWDIILFGYHCKQCTKKLNYRKVERFELTHCYAISNTCILKMLKSGALFPISQQIDALLSELSEILNIYTIKNPIINQSNSRTDIQMPLIHNANEYDRRDIGLKE